MKTLTSAVIVCALLSSSLGFARKLDPREIQTDLAQMKLAQEAQEPDLAQMKLEAQEPDLAQIEQAERDVELIQVDLDLIRHRKSLVAEYLTRTPAQLPSEKTLKVLSGISLAAFLGAMVGMAVAAARAKMKLSAGAAVSAVATLVVFARFQSQLNMPDLQYRNYLFTLTQDDREKEYQMLSEREKTALVLRDNYEQEFNQAFGRLETTAKN